MCDLSKVEDLEKKLFEEYNSNKNNKFLSKGQLEEYVSYSKKIGNEDLINKFESLRPLTKIPEYKNSVQKAYENTKKEFLTLDWDKNKGKLEIMLEDTKELIEKARYMDDKDLTYKLSELEDEISSVIDEVNIKKSRSVKGRIALSLGIGLTVFTLIQPYIHDNIIESYNNFKEKIETLF